ncbi:DUF4304 domain-containing protein [Methylomicrobium lacus]|uniref:DUF4304 domain-containing protein n=1 Tax=Methylomicrobium lacus TaxID=136992 RepID=UPI0035A899D9
MNTCTPRIESAIREHLAPVLRADGFAGSGRTFRRVAGQWIHVVNIQVWRYGGQFAVNLAVQPMAIPQVCGNTPDSKKITEELCEFRRRMSESQEREDRWWQHDSTDASMASAVQDATATYTQVGRHLLNDATAKDADLNTVTPSEFAKGNFNFLGFGSTECRMAFALARLRRAQGQLDDSRAFAAHAFQSAGSSAILIKAEIQTFLKHGDA